MEVLATLILRFKKTILVGMLLGTAICLVLMQMVTINESLSAYLPEDSPSTRALSVMGESFEGDLPNLNLMVEDLSIPEALALKETLLTIDGVSAVMWLDDVLDIHSPLELADPATVESWYKDGAALFMVTVDGDRAETIVPAVRAAAGEGAALSGDAVNSEQVKNITSTEMGKIMAFAVPLVFIVLLLTTNSWLEPFLFGVVIGVAILFNEGTNFFLGSVSFVTRSCAAILQLAVSMDYAVFLLHSYERYRGSCPDIQSAMHAAIVESGVSITSSSLTTVFGFLALAVMRFRIGADLGVVLAKGVVCSLLTVILLLPVLVLYTDKWLQKTRHRVFLPSFEGLGPLVLKVAPVLMVVILLFYPVSYLAQANNSFVYGTSGMTTEGSPTKLEADRIAARFGNVQQMALLIPTGDVADERALAEELEAIDRVTSVTTYTNAVGVLVPPEMLAESQISQLQAGGWRRMILAVDSPDEGEVAFRTVEAIRDAASRYYGDNFHLLGQSAVNYDLMTVITGDNLFVNLMSILAIAAILLFTFKSLSLPVLLVMTIEGAIWINLGITYFMGDPMNYLGYQIVSSVQLGATVDYGILYTQHYLDNRKRMGRKEAAAYTLSTTAATMLVPASILAIAGLSLGFISTNGIISQLGSILGRGALISVAMVIFFLPGLLALCDPIVRKTTLSTPIGELLGRLKRGHSHANG